MNKFVGTGPSSYKKRIYRAAVSQRVRNTGLWRDDVLEYEVHPSVFANHIGLICSPLCNMIFMNVVFCQGEGILQSCDPHCIYIVTTAWGRVLFQKCIVTQEILDRVWTLIPCYCRHMASPFLSVPTRTIAIHTPCYLRFRCIFS